MVCVPQFTEYAIADSFPNCEVVVYNISPTSANPATYPMLDPDPEIDGKCVF